MPRTDGGVPPVGALMDGRTSFFGRPAHPSEETLPSPSPSQAYTPFLTPPSLVLPATMPVLPMGPPCGVAEPSLPPRRPGSSPSEQPLLLSQVLLPHTLLHSAAGGGGGMLGTSALPLPPGSHSGCGGHRGGSVGGGGHPCVGVTDPCVDDGCGMCRGCASGMRCGGPPGGAGRGDDAACTAVGVFGGDIDGIDYDLLFPAEPHEPFCLPPTTLFPGVTTLRPGEPLL